jgi:hypothetical protein
MERETEGFYNYEIEKSRIPFEVRLAGGEVLSQ